MSVPRVGLALLSDHGRPAPAAPSALAESSRPSPLTGPPGAAHDLRIAQLPLFAEGVVDAVEVVLDQAVEGSLPAWLGALCDHYAAAGALYGHGVHFSLLSAEESAHQRRLLRGFSRELSARPYRHVSEHFGFMTLPGFRRGAPLPVPFTTSALALGRERLARIAEACGVPVGLENLALAMSRDEARRHGDFLDALLDGTDQFLLLDLHNLHCQAMSFSIDPIDLLDSMPLERVREIHVSGGTTYRPTVDPSRPFRRDTHDHDVPEQVFELMAPALDRCPSLEVVFLERLGGTFADEASMERYRADFHRLRGIVAGHAPTATARAPSAPRASPAPGHLGSLAALQRAMLEILPTAPSPSHAAARIEASSLAEPEASWVRSFDPRALEVAIEIAGRWTRRDDGRLHEPLRDLR